MIYKDKICDNNLIRGWRYMAANVLHSKYL